jgi:hypothetical protein
MKKTFDQKWGLMILSGVILFIAFYSAPVSLSADEEEPGFFDYLFPEAYYENLSKDIYEKNNIDPSVAPNWDNIFGSTGDDNAQNLYLLIYNKVKNDPASAALENTAAEYGYTKGRMMDLVGGDLYAIYDYDVTASKYVWGDEEASQIQSIEGLVAKYDEITNYYNNQLAIETLNSDLSNTAMSHEIFANGTTEDSGFDLIVDLKTIEIILFGAANEDGYGSEMSSPDNADDGSSGGLGVDTESPTEEEVVSDEPSSEEEEILAETEESATESDKSFECFENSNLSDALAGALGGSDSSTDGASSGSGSEDGTGSSADGSGDGGGDSSDIGIPIPAAADWSDPLPCTDTICLEVNFVTESDDPVESGMEETTNCIYCHFSYISQMLENITSHSLTPSKVTGNIMEDSTCKESSLKFWPNFYVFVIGSPILTPSNDDLIIDTGHIADNFIKALYPSRETDSSTGYSAADLNAMLVDNAGISSGLIDVTSEVMALTDQQNQAQAEILEQFVLNSQMSDANKMYQAISEQMEQFNLFFESILDLIGGDSCAASDDGPSFQGCIESIYAKDYTK